MFVDLFFEELEFLRYIDEEIYTVIIERSDGDSPKEINLINIDCDAISQRRFNESHSSLLANRVLLICRSSIRIRE